MPRIASRHKRLYDRRPIDENCSSRSVSAGHTAAVPLALWSYPGKAGVYVDVSRGEVIGSRMFFSCRGDVRRTDCASL